MKEIEINASSGTYKVVIGANGVLRNVEFVRQLQGSKRLFTIVDGKLFDYHKQKLEDFFFQLNISEKDLFKFQAKEGNKTFAKLMEILKSLIDRGFGRDTLILAIGGGITGDVVGFASAVFMRGVPYINFPTTLLADVDSSIGGKTGINFYEGKNLIGAFHQPKAVIIDLDFLHSLPKEELLCGLGEIIKYAFLFSEDLFLFLKRNIKAVFDLKTEILKRLIVDSVRLKASVVKKDEKESGYRKILNLGHTIAHALEIEQNHGIKHGAAVIFGIVASLFISEELGLIKKNYLNDYFSIFEELKSLIKLSKIKHNELIPLLLKDKKNRGQKIKFVLLRKISDVIIDVDVPNEIILNSVRKAEEFFNVK